MVVFAGKNMEKSSISSGKKHHPKNPSGKDYSGMSHPKPLSFKISKFEQNQ